MAFELEARLWFLPPKGSTFRDQVLRVGDHSVPVLWAQGPNGSKTGVILYFHGGGYVFGSPGTHSAMLAGLSLLTGMVACLLAYRLVPEQAFPAAIEVGITSYQALLRCGFASKDIVIGGDSAGGGLALAVLGQICATDLPQPIYLTVSDTEILLDDTTRMEAQLKAQEVQVETHVSKTLPHVWQIFQNLIPEADTGLRDIADCIRRLAPRNIAEN